MLEFLNLVLMHFSLLHIMVEDNPILLILIRVLEQVKYLTIITTTHYLLASSKLLHRMSIKLNYVVKFPIAIQIRLNT